MTKVIIIGQEPKKKELKPIEFTESLCMNKRFETGCAKPSAWKNIELISSHDCFDIMFAYDDNRNTGCLYLGHFNDGIV